MNTSIAKKIKPQALTILILFLLVSWGILPTGSAWAFRPEGRPAQGYPPIGMDIQGPLKGHWPVHIGALTYFFLEGIFYRPLGHGYAVAAAPVGAVIPLLPPFAAVIPIGGDTYYTYADVYYRKTPNGYVVTPPPREPVQTGENLAWEGDQIRVTVSILNVRSGPGMEHSIIKTVQKGKMLVVQSSNSGWYYVKLPDNTFGWVMVKFTSLLKPKALGAKSVKFSQPVS